MSWKEKLRKLEKIKAWDEAIQFMQEIVKEDPNNIDKYINLNYLLMNLLVEEDYDASKHDYYARLARQYFQESYTKFSTNAQYLFYTGLTGCFSEWYFNIEREELKSMMKQALYLEPNDIIFQWLPYWLSDTKKDEDKKIAATYAHLILQQNSPIQNILRQKGAIGEYLFDIMLNWARKVLS